MKKKLILSSLILLFLLVISGREIYSLNIHEDNIPNEVKKVAEDSLLLSATRMKPQLEEKYETEMNIELFTLGNGHQMYMINPADFEWVLGEFDWNKDYDSLKDIIVPMNIWYFVINYDGKSEYFMKISDFQNKIQLTEFGEPAVMFDKAIENFSKLKSKEMIFFAYDNIYLVDENEMMVIVPRSSDEYNLYNLDVNVPLDGKKAVRIIVEHAREYNKIRQLPVEHQPIGGGPELMKKYYNIDE